MDDNRLLAMYARQLMDPATAEAQGGYVPLPVIDFDLTLPTTENPYSLGPIATPTEAAPSDYHGENVSDDREQGDSRSEESRDAPYAWEEAFWGGDFSPQYGMGDALKSFGYGKGIAGRGRGFLGSLLGLNQMMDPRKDPAIRTGIEAFAAHYGLNPVEAWDHINKAIDGTSAKKTGLLGSLFSAFDGTTNNKVNAMDAIRGSLFGDVLGKNNTGLNLGQFSKPGLEWALGQTIDAMNSGYGVSLDDMSHAGDLKSAVLNDVFGELLGTDPATAYATQMREMIKKGNAPGESLSDALSGGPLGEYHAGRAANRATSLTDSLRDIDLTQNSSAALAQAVDAYQAAKTSYKNGSYSKDDDLNRSNLAAEKADRARRDSLRGGGEGGSGSRNDGARDSGGNHGANEGNRGDTGRGDSTESSSGSACFPAGTKISVEGGMRTTEIQFIKKGDKVVTYDTGSKKIDEDIVKKTTKKTVDKLSTITFESGKRLICTPNHPIVTPSGLASVDPEMTKRLDQKDVSQLENGMEVITLDIGRPDKVQSISIKNGNFEVYNLDDIGGENTFFADGFCVHNKW